MIEFTDVVKSYSVGTRALRGVSMQIEDGEFAFLVGPSGSGKSTIIKLITGELKPTSGTVHVNGYSLERIRKREIPYMRRTVGTVFQDFRLIPNKTVYENVAFVMRAVGARWWWGPDVDISAWKSPIAATREFSDDYICGEGL